MCVHIYGEIMRVLDYRTSMNISKCSSSQLDHSLTCDMLNKNADDILCYMEASDLRVLIMLILSTKSKKGQFNMKSASHNSNATLLFVIFD